MRLFFDRNLSSALATASNAVLQSMGSSAVSAYDRYPVDPGDIAWMQELAGEGGWTIITADGRIQRDPVEQRIWRESQMTTFFLAGTWLDQPLIEQSWRLLRWLPSFRSHVDDHAIGTGFVVPLRYSPGRLRVIYKPMAAKRRRRARGRS